MGCQWDINDIVILMKYRLDTDSDDIDEMPMGQRYPYQKY